MAERPYSRYTREKTWAALYSQHITAGYALVPWSTTENSIEVINCKDSNKPTQDLAKDTQLKVQELLEHEGDIAEYYLMKQTPDKAPTILATAYTENRLRTAVVLAKSSDYYHYSLDERPGIDLVICGLHDSYLHIRTWEISTNRRYRAREIAVSITDPTFDRMRRTQYGHNILLAAYAKGNADAIAFVESKSFPERSRVRMKKEKDSFQDQRYQGRPLAFRDAAKRKEASEHISQGLKEYYARKRLGSA